MADEERDYQPTLAERIADAIPTELTASPHVGVGGARRAKIAAAVMPEVQAELDKIRAEVAEGIARAILAAEPPQEETNPRYRMTRLLTYEQAAAIARGFKHPGLEAT